MLNPQEIKNNLDALIQYLRDLGVTVSLSHEEAEEVTIAQLRNQHIVINTLNRDGLNCVFTIAHLFGHLVQFLNYDKYAHLTTRVEGPKPLALEEDFRRKFREYEIEAFRIGKGLLEKCFEIPPEMDSKYTLFLETDFAHFWHFLTTGDKGDIASFNQLLDEKYKGWAENQQFLSPLPHPQYIRLTREAVVDVV